ncbi:Uncharacterised protein g6849 [Pycnogonum litorale]
MADTKEKRVRTGHRGHVKRVLSNVSELINDNNLDNDEQRDKLKTYRNILETKNVLLNGLNDKILDSISEDQSLIIQEIFDSSSFSEEIELCINTITRLLDTRSNKHNVSTVSSNGNTYRVRLPKLTLQTFDGSDTTSWPEFYDTFMSLVHNNDGLSDVDKLTYL